MKPAGRCNVLHRNMAAFSQWPHVGLSAAFMSSCTYPLNPVIHKSDDHLHGEALEDAHLGLLLSVVQDLIHHVLHCADHVSSWGLFIYKLERVIGHMQ